MTSLTTKEWLFLLFILALFLLGFSPYHALMRGDLRADDASYLSHGFSLGLDFNFQYRDMIADWRANNGQVPAHPIGPGLLAAPFIALFSIIDRIIGDPVIQDHKQYQYSWSLLGFILASVLYFMAGLFFYAEGLKKINLEIPRWQLWFTGCSFGILYYVLFRPIMGHSFEFFTLGLCFYFSARWAVFLAKENKISYQDLFGIGLSIILTLSIRPADINVILLPFIILTSFCALNKISINWHKVTLSLIVLIGALIFNFLPFAFINYSLYGMAYPSAEAMYGTHPTSIPPLHSVGDLGAALWVLMIRIPYIIKISFSSEFGIAFSSAILFYGTLFLLYHLRRNFLPLLLVTMYIGLPVAIILFWQSVGDAYAYRFLFCLFPLAILGYAMWWRQVRLAKHLQWGILACCLFGILASILFGLNEDLMYKDGSAKGYNIAVLRALPEPKTWLNCIATRTPGFYAVGLLEQMTVDLNALPLPGALAAKMAKFKHSYQYPPARIYLQILLLGAIFVGGSVVFCLREKKRYFTIQ